jgi:hypothetical protein
MPDRAAVFSPVRGQADPLLKYARLNAKPDQALPLLATQRNTLDRYAVTRPAVASPAAAGATRESPPPSRRNDGEDEGAAVDPAEAENHGPVARHPPRGPPTPAAPAAGRASPASAFGPLLWWFARAQAIG